SASAFHYTKKIIDQYVQSSVSSDQQIVYAARNLATKLLLENTTLISDPNPLLIENLVAVTNFPLATTEARSNALFELGNLYTSTKNLDEAISSYEQANEETQSNEMKNTILFRLAIIYFDVEDYEKFIPSASKLLESGLDDEKTLQLYFRLGLGHLELQQTDQAKSAFEQMLLIPNVSGEIHTHAHFYLAGIHQANQQLDLAKAEYRLVLSAIGKKTSDPAFRKIRTESAFQLAFLIEDANLYDQVISANLDPKMTAISLYRQGLLFDKNNNNEKAKEKFELLVDRFSDTIDSEIRSLVDNAILRLADDIEDSDRAIPHTLASLEVAKRKADPQLLAQIQFRLATLYNQDEDTYSKSASLF
ncbi:MAG: tetratricopeptide repeat protein, partial [Candidatus Poribacteria bacterium]|nr:tetratricopeptide repeat protein [Candidatus Poribacteria bacterium]